MFYVLGEVIPVKTCTGCQHHRYKQWLGGLSVTPTSKNKLHVEAKKTKYIVTMYVQVSTKKGSNSAKLCQVERASWDTNCEDVIAR